MPIDWTQPIQTRGGLRGDLKDRDGWQDRTGDTRRRVYVAKLGNAQWGTTLLASESGSVRGDGKPSDFDMINVADALAAAA